jgi:uncharacterized membrane protein YbaN (DUF454 family)
VTCLIVKNINLWLMILRILMISAGTLCLVVGLIGVIIPGLPTTPFLLLTAGFYIRSSDKLYRKLTENQFVGGYLTRWQTQKGLPLRTKMYSLILMWLMIGSSILWMIDSRPMQLVVLIVGLIGTLVMGFVIPTIGKRQ